MKWNREFLRVSTFPVGRGTTQNGDIYIYKDGKLIKDVPYIDIEISNDDFEKSFKRVSEETVQKLIGGELPPAI